MTISSIRTTLKSDVRKVWDTVLAVENYSLWRSDLRGTEKVNDKRFIEYTKSGYPTEFTVTAAELYRRWEFDMENANMKGRWVGVFTPKDGETEIDFTEYVTVKKFYLKPFVKGFLKKQQKQFVADLESALVINQA